jgi:hypothetical protein
MFNTVYRNTSYCGNIVSLPGSPKMGKPHIRKYYIVSHLAVLPKGKNKPGNIVS